MLAFAHGGQQLAFMAYEETLARVSGQVLVEVASWLSPMFYALCMEMHLRSRMEFLIRVVRVVNLVAGVEHC